MSKSSALKSLLDFVVDQSTYNTANVLIVLTSAGWLASSLAQIMGIYFNKNYTKEQKSFMIPQEFADACVNIGSFLLVTKSLKALTTKMVETGKLTLKSIQRFLTEKGLASERGRFDFNITEVEGFNAHRQAYNCFKTMAESTAAIVGGVLSSNIITPILRNKIASTRKDKVLQTLNDTEKYKRPQQSVTVPQTSQTNNSTIYTRPHSFNDFTRGSTVI